MVENLIPCKKKIKIYNRKNQGEELWTGGLWSVSAYGEYENFNF